MRQVFILSFLALSPLLIIGCGSPNTSTDTSSTPPQPSAQLPDVATPAPTAQQADSVPVAQVNAGLIPSTNAAVRSQSVSAGVRNDPFRGLSTRPTIEIKKEPGKSGGGGAAKSTTPAIAARLPLPNPILPGSGKGAASPAKGATSSPGSPKVGTSGSSKTGTSSAAKPSVPPAPPSTDLATAVQVTGVVQTGQSVVAIVRAPDEPTSRNVQAGERLSNGQVLVKRISVGVAGSPIVVLEQNGVEVIKTLNNAPSFLG